MLKCSAAFLAAALLTVPAMNALAQNNPVQPATVATPAIVAPQLKMDSFMRGVYWPMERLAWPAQNAGMEKWEFADKVLNDLKNRYHCDVVWVVNSSSKDAVKLSELGAKYDISVVPVVPAIYDWRNMRTQEHARKIAQRTVSELGMAPGISGYVLIDEPKRGDVEHLENIRAELARLDPTRPALTVSMLRQTEAVARRTQMPFLVPDPYSYFGPKSPNGPNTPAQSRDYYLNATQRTVAMARETNKSAWIMPQIFSDVWGDWHYDAKMNVVAEPESSLHWRMPTVGETRWQIWQAIGAGAKGAVFYVLFPTPNPRRSAADPKDMAGYRTQKVHPSMPRIDTVQPLEIGTAVLRNDGSSTPQAEAMGEVFAAIEPHRELLGRLEPTLPLASADAPLRATTFRDPANGQTIVIVVNENTDAAVTGKVQLLPNVKSVRDLIGNSDVAAQSDATTGLTELSLQIGAGEGKILALDGETAAVKTYVEDFGIQISAGKFERVQRTLVPVAWGMGYQIGVKTQPDAPTVGPQAAAADVVAVSAPAPANVAAPGQLQYDLANVAGDWKHMKGRLYLVYSGAKGVGKDSVEVSVSTDGNEFQRISLDEYEKPVVIPAGATQLRFTLLNNDALLREWQLIAVP